MTEGTPASDGPPDPVEAAVRVALGSHPSADDLTGLAAQQEAIEVAEIRPGLVKTFPPQVELVVTPADGGPVRTFDLVQELDGRLSFGGAHPPDVPGDAGGTKR